MALFNLCHLCNLWIICFFFPSVAVSVPPRLCGCIWRYNTGMSERVICDLCGQSVPPHAHYVVRIDVFADPAMPPIDTEELQEIEFDDAFAKLMDQMKHMSADDLQDGVHRRFEYKLCRPCQMKFLSNPLGQPRERHPGKN